MKSFLDIFVCIEDKNVYAFLIVFVLINEHRQMNPIANLPIIFQIYDSHFSC